MNEINGIHREGQNRVEISPEKIESAISKLKEIRKNEFNNGYNFIIENVEYLGLAALEEIAYPDKEFHEDILFDSIPKFELAEEILGYREIDNQFMNIHYICSDNFIQGMNAAARELLEKSK
jgi:hypothetical protein